MELKHAETTGPFIEAFEVRRKLGYVYENSLAIAARDRYCGGI